MEYDELLIKYLGEFGLYQRIVYFTICLTAIPAAFNIMSTVFLVGEPDHWCNTPELDHLNLSRELRLNATVPLIEEDGEFVYSSCEMYDRNYLNWTIADVENALTVSDPTKTVSCRDGWIYDQSLYHSTAATEFDMVCDNKWKQATSASVYMAGMMVGVMVFGVISDMIGRKITMCIAIVIMVSINISIAFVKNYIGFLALRFCLSMASIAQFTCAFVMGVELVGPSWRVDAGTIIEYYWAAGYIILAGIAYGIRDWRMLQLAISIPSAALLLFFFIIPESPRWLYITNKHERGDAIVKRIAKVNKKELPEKLDIVFQKSKRVYAWEVMKTPRLRYRTFNVFFNWFVNSFVYYGLSLNSSNLGGSPYLNFLISGAVEVPAYIFAQIVPSFMGRKLPLVGTLILSGVALLSTLAVPSDLNTISIVLSMIGKFAISASFAIIYFFTAELYPTPVRNVCVGVGSFGARIGGIVAPYVELLDVYGKFVPLTLFGCVSILAGLLAILFPETKGRNLPETMEDGENFGKKKSDKQVNKEKEENLNEVESGIAWNTNTEERNRNENVYTNKALVMSDEKTRL